MHQKRRRQPLCVEQGVERPLKKQKELLVASVLEEFREIWLVLSPFLIRDLMLLVMSYLDMPHIKGELIREMDFSVNHYKALAYGICTGREDEFFISDCGDETIRVIDFHENRLLRDWRGKRWFDGPTFLTFSTSANELYTLCQKTSLIQIFSDSGQFSRKWRVEERPLALAVSESNLLVAYTGHVDAYDKKTGAFMHQWTLALEGEDAATIEPTAMTVSERQVFVAMNHLFCVRAFREADGLWIRSFGIGILNDPVSLTVSRHEVYVSDANGINVFFRDDGNLSRQWRSTKPIIASALMGPILLGCCECKCLAWK